MKIVGFFVRHFTERGTEVATYDYAKYNEDILGNKSYIICFTPYAQRNVRFPQHRHSYNKFKTRFEVLEINDISEMSNVIQAYNLDFFYTLSSGKGDIYQFDNKNIWVNQCKTIKHCVFDTTGPESDYYISISQYLNEKNGTNLLVIPHMVSLPSLTENLRSELNISNDAIVVGRYGGETEFNLRMTHQAIHDFLNDQSQDQNTYFLFMNTRKFYQHPRIIYLDGSVDLEYKTKFINTCDAMIHARDIGETFGLSIAEFSIKNKPIITCPCGDLEHIKILKDKAIQYKSTGDLMHIFKNISTIIASKTDWNAFSEYSPEKIMKLFDEHIFNKTI
jgi:hypothetical protein